MSFITPIIVSAEIEAAKVRDLYRCPVTLKGYKQEVYPFSVAGLCPT